MYNVCFLKIKTQLKKSFFLILILNLICHHLAYNISQSEHAASLFTIASSESNLTCFCGTESNLCFALEPPYNSLTEGEEEEQYDYISEYTIVTAVCHIQQLFLFVLLGSAFFEILLHSLTAEAMRSVYSVYILRSNRLITSSDSNRRRLTDVVVPFETLTTSQRQP